MLKLSASVPAMRSINKDRKWVTVVKSSKDLGALKQSTSTWISDYGRLNITILRHRTGSMHCAWLGMVHSRRPIGSPSHSCRTGELKTPISRKQAHGARIL